MSDKLKNLIQDGIITDLIKAERALTVVQEIGKYHAKINESKSPLRYTFSYLQQVSLHEFVLATARIFDKPSTRNKTRCLLTLVKWLKTNPDNLPNVKQIPQTKYHLSFYKYPTHLIQLLDNNEHTEFAIYLGLIIESDLSNLGNSHKIVKSWRDKILSHNDQDNKVEKIVFKEVIELLDFAWQVVTIVGWAFLSTGFGVQGVNHLRQDATKYGFQVNQFLKENI